MLLGWVTNNYWETNFRAHQPGRVAARYRVLPHAGGFDETQAHRFGLDAAYNTPLVQHLGEPALESALPPGSGALLDLPAGDVLTMHVKPGSVQSGLVVRLINVTDRDAEATLASAALEIQGASLCDLLEHPVQPLTVRAGSLTIEVAARRVATVHLDVGMR
jgi:alpha-mannosidase